MTKGVEERIDSEFGHVERMGNDKTAKREYVRMSGKRWVDSVNKCLEKKKRASKGDRSEFQVFGGGREFLEHSSGDGPLTLTRYHSIFVGWRLVCSKEHKR